MSFRREAGAEPGTRQRQIAGRSVGGLWSILDQLGAVHPHVVSVLMDEATLLAHRSAWGSETAPARAALTRLTPEESRVYAALVGGEFGPGVRLEQELIDWDWARERLLPPGSGSGSGHSASGEIGGAVRRSIRGAAAHVASTPPIWLG